MPERCTPGYLGQAQYAIGKLLPNRGDALFSPVLSKHNIRNSARESR